MPSLDLRFAESKSLVDAVSGQNLITFTRASTGTFVDSDGVIRSAATNLALNSATFQPTSGAAPAAYTVDQVAPDGTTTGSRQTNASPRTLVDYTGIANGTYTFSFYCRVVSGTATFSIQIKDAATDTVRATDASPVATTTWRRYTITGTTSGATPGVRIEVTGVVAGFVFWGAQLEVGSTATTYIPTGATINSAPRFDHNPLTGECLGLLVEEQRQNLLLRSEEFDNASWTKTGATVSTDSAAGPSGTTTADKLVEAAGGTTHLVAQQVAVTSATVYTLSVFAKAAERSRVALYFGGAGGAAQGIIVNLSTGAFAANIVAAPTSYTITPFPNGWYRISITATSTGTAASYAVYVCDNTNAFSYSGDGTSGIHLWGAQLEAGAFPTSYIKTEGTAATRTADVVSITGANFSSWYRQDEGTVFADYTTQSTNGFCFDATGSATSDRIYLRYLATQHQLYVIDNGVTQASIYDTTAASSQSARVSVGMTANSFATYANGGGSRSNSLAQDASGTMPTLEKISIGTAFNAGSSLNGTLRRLAFWPARLTDSTLQSITL
jgi:hypothetical protein